MKEVRTSIEIAAPSMSFQKCQPVPKAALSNMNPSWSPVVSFQEVLPPALPAMALDPNSTYPYYVSGGRFIKHEEIIAPELLAAIDRTHYLVRQVRQQWWMRVEEEEEPFAQPGTTFLCRQDHSEYEIIVDNPTEEERQTLKYKKVCMRDEMAYFRSIWITIEYGCTYEGNRHWTRYTVAYLKDGTSPYPFEKDCRPEHHRY